MLHTSLDALLSLLLPVTVAEVVTGSKSQQPVKKSFISMREVTTSNSAI
jgi:hypothetical protein